MLIRIARQEDIETLFKIRTSVVENHQSREEIAELGITPTSIADMLATDCCAWIAQLDGQDIGFSMANKTEKNVFGLTLRVGVRGVSLCRRLKNGYGPTILMKFRYSLAMIPT